jgi:hypothetical protein
MKTLAWMAVAFGILPVAFADDKKEEPKEEGGVKWVVDQFDKAWGIKLKSIAIKDSMKFYPEVKMTLEFTKDVADVAEMQKAFVGSGGGISSNPNTPIIFYAFDEDSVSIGKYSIMRTEGDLTGVKGDAFRLFVQIDKRTLEKAKKVEARLSKPSKAKDGPQKDGPRKNGRRR